MAKLPFALVSLGLLLSLNLQLQACNPIPTVQTSPFPPSSSATPTPCPTRADEQMASPAIADFVPLSNGGLVFTDLDRSQIRHLASSQAVVQVLPIKSGKIHNLLLSPDQKRVLVLSSLALNCSDSEPTQPADVQLSVLELETGQLKQLEGLQTHSQISLPQWFPNSQQFVYLDQKSQLKRYDLSSAMDHLVSAESGLSNPLVAANGQDIFVTRTLPGMTKQVIKINAEEKLEALTPTDNQSNTAVALYPDGNILVSRLQANKLGLFKITPQNKVLEEISFANLYALAGHPSPDGKHLFVEFSSSLNQPAMTEGERKTLFLSTGEQTLKLLTSEPQKNSFPSLIVKTHWLDNDKALYLKSGQIFMYDLNSQKETLYKKL
jgi:hypothetical protein